MLLLEGSSSKSNEFLSFVDRNFENCIIEAAFLNIPSKANAIGLSAYLNSVVKNREENERSTNIYKIFPNSLIDTPLFLKISRYYDFIITTNSIFQKIRTAISESAGKEILAEIPLLLLPEVPHDHIENVLFVNSVNSDPFPIFKKFCYLFPSMCGKHDIIFLQLFDKKISDRKRIEEQREKLSEKKLFEYLNAKCRSLFVYQTDGTLNERDIRAIKFTERTLLVLGESNEPILTTLFGGSNLFKNNISFSSSG